MGTSDEPQGERQASYQTVSEVFDALWNELSNVTGGATTAALLRRVIADCKDICTTLAHVHISIGGNGYTIEPISNLPENVDMCDDLVIFVDSVLELLHELTGPVLVRYMLNNPTIRLWSSRGEEGYG